MNCPTSISAHWTVTINGTVKESDHVFAKYESWDFIKWNNREKLHMHMLLKVKFEPEMLKSVDDRISQTFSFLINETFKDFAFNVEKQTITVHKNFIAAASPVFAAMLEPHTKESLEGKVEIKDFDYVTVKAAVDWMYLRYLNDNSSIRTLLNLCKFVDKYDLAGAAKIFDKVREKLNLSILLDVLKFSKINSLDKLYDRCVEFFGKEFEHNAKYMKNFDSLELQFLQDVIKKRYRS
uniref:BTB domain-containing protein n=1 Tax=Panagrolaimus sp. JU765 TaxID=591449 RepID=A0AC34QEA6_9BILA